MVKLLRPSKVIEEISYRGVSAGCAARGGGATKAATTAAIRKRSGRK
jgi:hypothetical protein